MGNSETEDIVLFQTSPWDFGLVSNIQAALGKSFLLWAVPTTLGLGLDEPHAGESFAVNVSHRMYERDWDYQADCKEKEI